jgi:CheY-like chemotaxis protein
MKQKAFGTHDVARVCHVTPPTVGRWIEEGLLPSFTTGGGHRRVWDEDLRAFLLAHNIPLPADLLPLDPLRVLVVDDEPRLRQMMLRALKTAYPTAEFHEAEDGFDAGRKISELLPALVVLDVMLPGMDGLKVCENVKKDARLKNIRILVITGTLIDASRKSWASAGADGFLAKPFRPEALLSEVKKLLPVPLK